MSARSVKLLGKKNNGHTRQVLKYFLFLDQINNPDDPETRDAWWTELRKEIRSHKKTLGCNAVLGYTETAYINDEMCILSACGTAALLKTSETEVEAIFNYYQNCNYSNNCDRKEYDLFGNEC